MKLWEVEIEERRRVTFYVEADSYEEAESLADGRGDPSDFEYQATQETDLDKTEREVDVSVFRREVDPTKLDKYAVVCAVSLDPVVGELAINGGREWLTGDKLRAHVADRKSCELLDRSRRAREVVAEVFGGDAGPVAVLEGQEALL